MQDIKNFSYLLLLKKITLELHQAWITLSHKNYTKSLDGITRVYECC